MANVKLFGLVLIITTSILALAAISTQTNRIRIRSFSSDESVANELYSDVNTPGFGSQSVDQPPQYSPYDPANSQQLPYQQVPVHQRPNDVQFVSISIVIPLCVAGLVGMLLWLTPTGNKTIKGARRSSSRKRR